MKNNDDHTAGNLLIYDYFSKYYKLIAIDWSKQTESGKADLTQQINFIGRLERNNEATIFFILKKSEETTFHFSQNLVSTVSNENSKKHKFLKWFT